MFGLGWSEIFVIAIVALLVVGPDKLPEVARSLAKGLRQAQRLMNEVRNTINLDEFESQINPKEVRPASPHEKQPMVDIVQDNEGATVTDKAPLQSTEAPAIAKPDHLTQPLVDIVQDNKEAAVTDKAPLQSTEASATTKLDHRQQ